MYNVILLFLISFDVAVQHIKNYEYFVNLMIKQNLCRYKTLISVFFFFDCTYRTKIFHLCNSGYIDCHYYCIIIYDFIITACISAYNVIYI